MPKLPPRAGETPQQPSGDVPLPSSMSLVKINEARTARDLAAVLARKPDDRMSDGAWTTLHYVGELAVDKLKGLIEDPAFEKRSLNEKIKIIELALNRAYGNVETGAKRPVIKRNLNENSAGGNTLSRLARVAKYPELKGSPNVSDDDLDD